MAAMMTPEEMQAAYPLPEGWHWLHDEDGWNAGLNTNGDAIAPYCLVYFDIRGDLCVSGEDDPTRGAPLAVVLAVIAANAPQPQPRAAPAYSGQASKAIANLRKRYPDGLPSQ